MVVREAYGAVARVDRGDPAGQVLIVCEHASNRIPEEFGNLGLSEDDLRRHIAWDPGALGVAEAMGGKLRATLVRSEVSRLVYDCNRSPESPSAIPEKSETCEIPGNRNLSDAARQARIGHVFTPFHKAVEAEIDRHGGALGLLVTIHSFTPIYNGAARTVEIGLLHGADDRFARAMLEMQPADFSFNTRLNEPYSAADGVTYTLDRHGSANGLLNIMIEIRNDLIAESMQQSAMAARLAPWIQNVLASFKAVAT